MLKKIVAVLMLALVVCGCDQPVNSGKANARYISIGMHTAYDFEHEGHRYIFISDCGIIHSESCPCKVK